MLSYFLLVSPLEKGEGQSQFRLLKGRVFVSQATVHLWSIAQPLVISFADLSGKTEVSVHRFSKSVKREQRENKQHHTLSSDKGSLLKKPHL